MTRSMGILGSMLLAASPVLAADPPSATTRVEKGDLWEVTSQMTMEGMEGFSIPARTKEVCSDKSWKKPPIGGEEQGCQPYDVVNTPTKSSWKIKCDKPEPMTGEGEITRTSPGAYTGWMKFAAPQGTMNMTLSGKKVGECDVAAVRQGQADQIARIQAQQSAAEAQMASALAQSCESAVTTLNLMYLTMQGGNCTDPKYKTAFCARLQTREGYELEMQNTMPAPYSQKNVATYCGANYGDIKKRLCTEAGQARDLKFIGPNCPEQAQEIAKQECAGRDGTAFLGSDLGQICATYAKGAADGSETDKPAEQKPESAGKKAKKALKNIWP